MRRIKEIKNILALTVVYLVIIAVFWILKIPCLYQYFLGISCPGCGMTRAFVSALSFDFKAAFSYHPMFWSVPILYVYLLFGGKLFNKKYIDFGILILIALGFLVTWLSKVV